MIITVIQQIHGAAGAKKLPKLKIEDIYPQLSTSDGTKKKPQGNNLVDWDNTPPHLREEFIMAGLFDEDGNPKGYNPH